MISCYWSYIVFRLILFVGCFWVQTIIWVCNRWLTLRKYLMLDVFCEIKPHLNSSNILFQFEKYLTEHMELSKDCYHIIKNSTVVNFINILCAPFLYESLFGSFYLVTFWLWWKYESTFVWKTRAKNIGEIDT